jgi:hypothetical protein
MLEVNKAADFCACGRIFSCVIMENKHLAVMAPVWRMRASTIMAMQ